MNKSDYDRILLPLGFIYWQFTPATRKIPFVGAVAGTLLGYRLLNKCPYGDIQFCTQAWIPLAGGVPPGKVSRVIKWAEKANLETLRRHGITDELIQVSKVLEFCP